MRSGRGPADATALILFTYMQAVSLFSETFPRLSSGSRIYCTGGTAGGILYLGGHARRQPQHLGRPSCVI